MLVLVALETGVIFDLLGHFIQDSLHILNGHVACPPIHGA
jgi:hypothetical protein